MWKAILLKMWFVYFAAGLFGRWEQWHRQQLPRSHKGVARCHDGDLSCYCMLTWTCLFIFHTPWGDPAQSVIHFFLVSTYKIAHYAWHCHVYNNCCPTFQSRITWLVLVQSTHTDTVIRLNKRTQNRLQPVPSGLLLFLLLPCLKP